MNANETLKELIEQTDKWLKKAQDLEVYPINEKGEEFLINIKAYINDTTHFISKKDYVRAFEAIVWAWSWIEIGENIEILSVKDINKNE
jgi:uncharacterized protein